MLGLAQIAPRGWADTAPNYLDTIREELKAVERSPVDPASVVRVTTSNRDRGDGDAPAPVVPQGIPVAAPAVPADEPRLPDTPKPAPKPAAAPRPAPVPAVARTEKAPAAVPDKPVEPPSVKPRITAVAPAKKAARPAADAADTAARPKETAPVTDLTELSQFDLAGGEAEAIMQFQESLRTTYPGSYYLLRRLPEAEKREVFLEYRASGDIVRVRNMILQFVRSHW